MDRGTSISFAEEFRFGTQGVRVLALVVALASAIGGPTFAQSAEPLQKVVPIYLSAATGSITVGTTVYAAGTNPGLHMVALKRQPDLNRLAAPDLIGNSTFTDPAAANQFLGTTLSTAADAILIVNTVGNYGFGPSAIADSLHKFGAAHDIDSISSAIPFVFLGNGGLNTGVGARHRSGDQAARRVSQ